MDGGEQDVWMDVCTVHQIAGTEGIQFEPQAHSTHCSAQLDRHTAHTAAPQQQYTLSDTAAQPNAIPSRCQCRPLHTDYR